MKHSVAGEQTGSWSAALRYKLVIEFWCSYFFHRRPQFYHIWTQTLLQAGLCLLFKQTAKSCIFSLDIIIDTIFRAIDIV